MRYLVAVVLAAACADKTPATADAQKAETPARGVAANSVPTSDSLRGILGVRGSDSMPDLVLEAVGDTVLLRSAETETLRRVIGFEIVIRGTRAAKNFDVASFVARAFDDEPVTDGTLDVANGVFFVRTADGQRADISRIPGPLRGEIGSRVYLVGPLDRMPSAFGIITEGR